MSIKNIEELGHNFLKIVKGRMRLFMLELNLAKYSFLPFLFLAIGCSIIVSVIWLLMLSLIGYVLFYYTQEIVISIIWLLLINFAVGGILFALLCRYFNQMKFLRTRRQFKTAKQAVVEGVEHAKNNAIKEAN